jgi:hypothetical protein
LSTEQAYEVGDYILTGNAQALVCGATKSASGGDTLETPKIVPNAAPGLAHNAGMRKTKRKRNPCSVLRLPDLEQSKSAVRAASTRPAILWDQSPKLGQQRKLINQALQ